MSTSAIVMMIIALVVIWGGFILSVWRLPEEWAFFQQVLQTPHRSSETQTPRNRVAASGCFIAAKSKTDQAFRLSAE